MSNLVAWALYADDGTPVTGVVPTFVDYCDKASAARTQPSIVELGGGQYGFVPTSADETAGTVFLVDNGATSSPRYVSGSISLPETPFAAWHLEDANGALWTGTAPTVGSYVASSGPSTPVGIVSVRTYLFALTPLTADLAVGISFRADSASGAEPSYMQGALTSRTTLPAQQSILGIRPAAAAAKALRDWLLLCLPGACTAINTARAATLRATGPGPYTIPAGAILRLSVTTKAGTTYAIPLTAGSRTATQIAAEINAVVSGLASEDSAECLLLTSQTQPSYNTSTLAHTNSVVAVGGDMTGANAAFGWDVGGEHCVTTPLVPPGPQGVCDGMPLQGFFNPSQLGKGRVLVTIGERTMQPVDDNPRRFEWLVTLELGIFRAEPQQVVHQSREGIQAALQAVHECLMTDDGKQLGRAAFGDVQYGRLREARIAPFSFRATSTNGQPLPGGITFDAVNCKYLVRVYQATT